MGSDEWQCLVDKSQHVGCGLAKVLVSGDLWERDFEREPIDSERIRTPHVLGMYSTCDLGNVQGRGRRTNRRRHEGPCLDVGRVV
jgi:hypothetical protein